MPPDFTGASSRQTRGPGPRAQPATTGSVSNQQFAGGSAKGPEEAPEDAARAAEEPQLLAPRGRHLQVVQRAHGIRFPAHDGPRRGLTRPSGWMSLCTRVSCTWRASGARRRVRPWSSPLRSQPRACSLSESPALAGCSVLGARGGPKGRTCRNADQRETGATTVEV